MRVVASDQAAELIAERGGRLYVWLTKGSCCGAVMTLAAASEPKPGKEFRAVAVTDRFELYVPSALARLPDELHLEVRRFPRRIEAYWDGCAWVT
jgi:hypothetical protein